MIRTYAQVRAADRRRTLDHEDELLDAAQDAIRTGWHGHEFDALCSRAKALRVVLWPALCQRLMAEAAETTAVLG